MPRLARRRFSLIALGSSLLPMSAISLFCSTDVAKAQATVNADPSELQLSDRNADDWIKQWKVDSLIHKELQGPLDVRRFLDPMYVLLCSIGWKPKEPTANFPPLIVPAGFVTDFASVPRVFWSIFPPDGNYAYAAVLHDYLYWEQNRPKSAADSIFRYAMDDLKITDWQAETLYRAVDMFGTSAWNENAKLKAKGEKRILTKMPPSSDIAWADWKARPDVFIK